MVEYEIEVFANGTTWCAGYYDTKEDAKDGFYEEIQQRGYVTCDLCRLHENAQELVELCKMQPARLKLCKLTNDGKCTTKEFVEDWGVCTLSRIFANRPNPNGMYIKPIVRIPE